jgi:exopolyphosphatase/guanosine-5'-triphosphate,3'-diphosphate pyrophosphatase
MGLSKREEKLIRAAVDIGTNSSLFLLAQIGDDGRILPRRHEVRTNDLGRGLDEKGRLTDATIELNLRHLAEFMQMAQAGGARELVLAGTEALRRAANASELIQRAREGLGLEIRVISGEQEAALTYLGVVSGLPDEDRARVVVDVGGGSTEMILGCGHALRRCESLPLGAVSLDRRYIRHDPPLADEITEITHHLHRSLTGSLLKEASPESEWILCGGTASALASADLGLADYRPEKIGGHRMTSERIERFVRQFSTSTLGRRRAVPGIGRRRAEIILPGTLIIHELMKAAQIEAYQTSERGLRYGLLLSRPS